MVRSCLLIMGSLVLVVFVNGVARWSAEPSWPPPEDDRETLEEIHQEMVRDYGNAWHAGPGAGSVMLTNAPLHHEMMDAFAEKLVDRFGPNKQRQLRDPGSVATTAP